MNSLVASKHLRNAEGKVWLWSSNYSIKIVYCMNCLVELSFNFAIYVIAYEINYWLIV